MLFYFYDIKSRFFFAEVFKTLHLFYIFENKFICI